MKKRTDFTIDLTEKYPSLKLEVCICDTEPSYDRLVDLFNWLGEFKPFDASETDATFFGFVDKNKPSNPIGLILLKKGFNLSTAVHELFHAARWYFKSVGKRINEDRDETFAHLLSDLVEEFEANHVKG